MKKTIEDCLHKTFDLFEYHFSIRILLCSCWVKGPTKLETQLILEAIFFNLNIILTSYGCFKLTNSNLLEHM
jgi:hypothetical protein